MEESSKEMPTTWLNPSEVMKLHKLKMKKRALQARIKGNVLSDTSNVSSNKTKALEDILAAKKRKNPFLCSSEMKRTRPETAAQFLDESTDQTLFKLLHENSSIGSFTNPAITSFSDIFLKESTANNSEIVDVTVKGEGETWFPIDWTLKTKIRLWAKYPFHWNHKLKISEEASGVTGFARCLDTNNSTTLDTAPNARFHQCCLYWQHPSLPWLSLFPRTGPRRVSESSSSTSIATNSTIRSCLQAAWADSFRSLFQLIRTKQCPYFYMCTNTCTVLFRAAGMCGFSDVHALITPTTRGFRQLLKQEEIDFEMPLKKRRHSDPANNTSDSANAAPAEKCNDAPPQTDEEEPPDEQWLREMGINAEDIKKINYTQDKIAHKTECEIDNSDQSLVMIEGVEVSGLYNFLINCKSTTSLTGPLAGIPPTLLAPVAFNGATLNALKIRENKLHIDNCDFYSLEMSGPILPSTIHNLFVINPTEHSMSATFSTVPSTSTFSKIKKENGTSNIIFDKENLSDCGLNEIVLKQFCMQDPKIVSSVDCLKYNSDTKTYTWT